jgi:hypothetical protein
MRGEDRKLRFCIRRPTLFALMNSGVLFALTLSLNEKAKAQNRSVPASPCKQVCWVNATTGKPVATVPSTPANYSGTSDAGILVYLMS